MVVVSRNYRGVFKKNIYDSSPSVMYGINSGNEMSVRIVPLSRNLMNTD